MPTHPIPMSTKNLPNSHVSLCFGDLCSASVIILLLAKKSKLALAPLEISPPGRGVTLLKVDLGRAMMCYLFVEPPTQKVGMGNR